MGELSLTGGKMPRAIDVFVGSRIRDHRIQMGLTQQELGRRIGVDAAEIDACESGQTKPDPVRLVLLAAVLDCSIGDLYGFHVQPWRGLGFASDADQPARSERVSALSWSARRAGRAAVATADGDRALEPERH